MNMNPRLWIYILTVASLWSCQGKSPQPTQDAWVSDQKEIVILTRNAPTTYYVGRDDQIFGLEYELGSLFANFVGRKAKFVLLDSTDDILRALEAGEGDVAAATLTATEQRKKRFLFGPPYQKTRQEVVCKPHSRFRKIEDLVGLKIAVGSNTSYEEELQRLRRKHPTLAWESDDDRSTEQLLEAVWKGDLDCTVADSNVVAINRRYMPDLAVPFPLSEEQDLVWMVARHRPGLLKSMDSFFGKVGSAGQLKSVLEKNFGFLEDFDFYDTRVFHRRLQKLLPKYQDLFIKVAKADGYPWVILAAVSYQESHWNPKAKSPTGVRGMMMLTQPTAKAMGVTNRLDTLQSLQGGSKYLKKMVNRVPTYVPLPDRYYMALASYNVGFGHLRDARVLAMDLNKNPNSWADVREVLPLLSQKKYHQRVRHGYARGSEAVVYVDRIRHYHDLLDKHVRESVRP